MQRVSKGDQLEASRQHNKKSVLQSLMARDAVKSKTKSVLMPQGKFWTVGLMPEDRA
jgi:hypothetical protein